MFSDLNRQFQAWETRLRLSAAIESFGVGICAFWITAAAALLDGHSFLQESTLVISTLAAFAMIVCCFLAQQKHFEKRFAQMEDQIQADGALRTVRGLMHSNRELSSIDRLFIAKTQEFLEQRSSRLPLRSSWSGMILAGNLFFAAFYSLLFVQEWTVPLSKSNSHAVIARLQKTQESLEDLPSSVSFQPQLENWSQEMFSDPTQFARLEKQLRSLREDLLQLEKDQSPKTESSEGSSGGSSASNSTETKTARALASLEGVLWEMNRIEELRKKDNSGSLVQGGFSSQGSREFGGEDFQSSGSSGDAKTGTELIQVKHSSQSNSLSQIGKTFPNYRWPSRFDLVVQNYFERSAEK